MPTITCSFKDLVSLVGKKLSIEQLRTSLESAKAELERVAGDELTIELNDTNQPYLWSVEGIARFLRSSLGKTRGIPQLKLAKPAFDVIVDKSVSRIRPFISAFLAKGPALTQVQLDQLIQLQEKIALSFGRKRKKVAAGLFPAKGVQFPLKFKAVSPNSVKFTPLGMRSKMTLSQVLKEHPKGKQYGWILEGAKRYPVVMSSKGDVVTFPPIVNSEDSGKLEVGDSEIVVEVTGTDYDSVNLASTIFAYALADRGYRIHPANIKPGRRISPEVKSERFRFDLDLIESLLGISLKQSEIKSLLERAQYSYKGKGIVEVPPYRKDVLHSVDVIEDIAIMRGYKNIEALPLEEFTAGAPLPIAPFADSLRSLWTGLEYQEVCSAILSNKELLTDKMGVDMDVVEIENYMSLTYSCVRSWLLPILVDVLSKNRHVEYPQKIFEQGLVTIRKGDSVLDENHIAAASAHASASFTEMKQAVEFLLRNVSAEYSVEEFDYGCFIPGRSARILVNGQVIGFFGEIHPAVLENFGLTVPVVGAELNITRLFSLRS